MPPAKKPTRSRAPRANTAYKEPAALTRLTRSLDAAQDALLELGKDTGRDVGQGARQLYKDLRTFLSNARRDSGKLGRALRRDFEQAQKRLADAGSSTRRGSDNAPSRARAALPSGQAARARTRPRAGAKAPARARSAPAAAGRSPTPPGRAATGATRAAIVEALAGGQAMTATQIAAATGLARGTVSTTLSRLTKAGEITKAARGYQLAETGDDRRERHREQRDRPPRARGVDAGPGEWGS